MRQALELLLTELRTRIDRHPWAHLIADRNERVALELALPLTDHEGQMLQAVAKIDRELQQALESILAHRAAFQPGKVFCLRCGRADCGHGAPVDARHVFTGLSPTGQPRFADLGQWLLERQDPRVDQLYDESAPPLACVVSAEELTGSLLPSFRDGATGFRLHGEVVAGWFRLPDPRGRPSALAVSLPIISSQPRGSRRRFGLNVLGAGPAGESLEHLYDRLGAIPWTGPVRWAQSVLDQIERSSGRRRGSGPLPQRRIEGLLGGLARRLQRGERARQRRTVHAQQRHIEGDRPTRMALADLARAGEEDLLFDRRRKTLIVLGERGRAHVFSPAGRLVTSVRYAPAAIERKRQLGIWLKASPRQVEVLRRTLAAD
ncbi:MAG: hypothetical protein JSV80_12910 [Acidobacteriota bacterium]|nr:MAG: hypothetical protein JSV80_12910 [Acidobacteriota bacterium]